MFAKPGFMAVTWSILALLSFRSLWLFPMFMPSFSPNCWLHSWASNDLMWPFTPRLLRNAPKTSCMTCAMHGMLFLNADHWITDTSSVDCSSSVIEWFEEALSVVKPSKQQLVRSKRSGTTFKCITRLAPVCWPLTYHYWFAFETGNEQGINVIDSELNFMQCPIVIHMVSNDWRWG